MAEHGPESGTPVLLVHGWPQHWWCWRKVAAELPAHRCVMPDLRGHGWSEAPSGRYEKRQLADDMLELLDALEIDRVCFVGHDWGAIVGFLLAMGAPERISALLALSVPHPWPSRRDRLDPRRLAAGLYQLPLSSPFAGALLRAGLVKRVLAGASPPGTFSPDEIEVYDARISTPAGARTTVAMYRTFLLRELPAIARGRVGQELEVTTRLVVGERDLIVRTADLRGYEPHAPRMSVERVPDAGHFLPEERPELIAAHVRDLCPQKQAL